MGDSFLFGYICNLFPVGQYVCTWGLSLLVQGNTQVCGIYRV